MNRHHNHIYLVDLRSCRSRCYPLWAGCIYPLGGSSLGTLYHHLGYPQGWGFLRCSFGSSGYHNLGFGYLGFDSRGFRNLGFGSPVTRTPVRAVRVQAYVRIGSRTIRAIRFIAMIPAVFICKLTTLFP